MMEKRLLVFLRLSEVKDEKMQFEQVVSDNPSFLPTTRTPPPSRPPSRCTASDKRREQVQP